MGLLSLFGRYATSAHGIPVRSTFKHLCKALFKQQPPYPSVNAWYRLNSRATRSASEAKGLRW
jgi:hypothetical protein